MTSSAAPVGKNGVNYGVPSHLIAVRKARGLTQRELAKRTGMTRPEISLYESGERRLTPTKLEKLAKVLDVSVDAFSDPDALPQEARPWMSDLKGVEPIATMDTSIVVRVGARVRDLRVRVMRSHDIEQFARLTGLPTLQLERIEDGHDIEVGIDTVEKIAIALGVRTDYLTASIEGIADGVAQSQHIPRLDHAWQLRLARFVAFQRRVERGLTRAQMRAQTGLTRTAIENIELASGSPTLVSLAAVAKLLGTTVTALLQLTDESAGFAGHKNLRADELQSDVAEVLRRISRAIYVTRERYGYNHAQLADVIGCTAATVRKLEMHNAQPSGAIVLETFLCLAGISRMNSSNLVEFLSQIGTLSVPAASTSHFGSKPKSLRPGQPERQRARE